MEGIQTNIHTTLRNIGGFSWVDGTNGWGH